MQMVDKYKKKKLFSIAITLSKRLKIDNNFYYILCNAIKQFFVAFNMIGISFVESSVRKAYRV